MSLRNSLISLFAVILGFLGGFLLANALNRSDYEKLRIENENLKSEIAQNKASQSEMTLSDEEIKQRIAEADKNPNDIKFNKGLGIALYHYGASKQNEELIRESMRLLERVNSNGGKDVDTLTALGNGFFDLGYMQKGDDNFGRSRQFYKEALALDPNNAPVRTDYGLTYFLVEAPDLDRTISELETAHKLDPKYDKALQFLVQAYWKQKDNIKAGEYLDKLKELNPNSPYIPELMSLLAREPELN